MNGFDQATILKGRSGCFLPERRYFCTVLRALQEATSADGRAHTADAQAVPEALTEDAKECDDDIGEATRFAMHAELSGTQAEDLAWVIRALGAESSAEVVAELRVAYAACVRELHARKQVEPDKEFLVDLALQLVDPIRGIGTPVATFGMMKILVELLAYAGVEIDVWEAPLWIRLLHPHGRIGAAKAVMSLAADYQATNESGQRGGSLTLEPHRVLRRRNRRRSATKGPEKRPPAEKGVGRAE